MLNSSKGYKLKVFGKPEPIQITNKISKNKLRKQQIQKKEQKNNDSGITDAEFESMMAENDYENENKNQYNKITTKNTNNKKYKYEIPELDDVTGFVKELLNKNITGQELVDYIESNYYALNGIELLKGLLKSQLDISDISDISWFRQEKYGLGLKKLFESNIHDQVIGLLMFQNYCSLHQFPKIQYKNKPIYLLKALFQLFFTYNIFEEEAYWGWQEYIDDNNEINDELKKTLSIQTAEFFIILKTVFTEEDYKNEEEGEENKNDNIQ